MQLPCFKRKNRKTRKRESRFPVFPLSRFPVRPFSRFPVSPFYRFTVLPVSPFSRFPVCFVFPFPCFHVYPNFPSSRFPVFTAKCCGSRKSEILMFSQNLRRKIFVKYGVVYFSSRFRTTISTSKVATVNNIYKSSSLNYFTYQIVLSALELHTLL